MIYKTIFSTFYNHVRLCYPMKEVETMIHLKSIIFSNVGRTEFPYHLPFFGKEFIFSSPVTLFVGENGSGKSTLLELLDEVLKLYKINSKQLELKNSR